MNPDIENSVEIVAAKLDELVGEDYVAAWLYAEVENGAYSADGFVLKPDASIHYLRLVDDIGPEVHQLWGKCVQHSPEPWNTMTLTLKDGSFEIDFDYEPLDSLGYEPSIRRKKWLARYIGESTRVIYPKRAS